MSIATSACVVCHRKVPRTHMVQVETTQRSGHSNGGGMSWGNANSKGNRNPRYFGSRRHYHRVRKEWWCNSCRNEYFNQTHVKIGNFIAIVFGYYLGIYALGVAILFGGGILEHIITGQSMMSNNAGMMVLDSMNWITFKIWDGMVAVVDLLGSIYHGQDATVTAPAASTAIEF